MKIKPLPDAGLLRAAIRYNRQTGQLFWKERTAEHFPDQKQLAQWNACYAGKEILGNLTTAGHRQVCIQSARYYKHRVIWKLVTGNDPVEQIDHINGDGTDNRFCNLREATRAQNSHNCRMQINNTSGHKGVSRHKATGKWQAYITVNNRRRHYLGIFDTAEEAAAARRAAAEKLHGTFVNHG